DHVAPGVGQGPRRLLDARQQLVERDVMRPGHAQPRDMERDIRREEARHLLLDHAVGGGNDQADPCRHRIPPGLPPAHRASSRSMNTPHFASSLSATNSSALCAWSIEPGPITTEGMPAAANRPASVPYATLAWSRAPISSLVSPTSSAFAGVSSPGNSDFSSNVKPASGAIAFMAGSSVRA